MRLAAAIVLVTLSGCKVERQVGAASVRWAVFDQTTGQRASGGCRHDNNGANIHVTIDEVEILVRYVEGSAPDGGGEGPTCSRCRFECTVGEGTTPFELPPGIYTFALRALRCGQKVGMTPPSVVRTVRPGEITNLDAVQILLPPCERTLCLDGGEPPRTCDGGWSGPP